MIRDMHTKLTRITCIAVYSGNETEEMLKIQRCKFKSFTFLLTSIVPYNQQRLAAKLISVEFINVYKYKWNFLLRKQNYWYVQTEQMPFSNLCNTNICKKNVNTNKHNAGKNVNHPIANATPLHTHPLLQQQFAIFGDLSILDRFKSPAIHIG